MSTSGLPLAELYAARTLMWLAPLARDLRSFGSLAQVTVQVTDAARARLLAVTLDDGRRVELAGADLKAEVAEDDDGGWALRDVRWQVHEGSASLELADRLSALIGTTVTVDVHDRAYDTREDLLRDRCHDLDNQAICHLLRDMMHEWQVTRAGVRLLDLDLRARVQPHHDDVAAEIVRAVGRAELGTGLPAVGAIVVGADGVELGIERYLMLPG